MTEDELLFAIDAIHVELRKAKDLHKRAVSFIQDQSKSITRNEQIKTSLLDTLGHLFGSPVISIGEYRSLINGLKTTNTHLDGLYEKRTQWTRTQSEAAGEIARLESQIENFEQQLETYVAPRVVLEFKR